LIGHVLAHGMEFQPNFTIQRGSDLESLTRQREELADAFRRFRDCLPREYQIELGKNSVTKESIMHLVENARKSWETKRDSGRFAEVKKHFHRITNKLDSHSHALKMLPTESEYVSIFYGSIFTVIQVC
jgi:hypothetical protein